MENDSKQAVKEQAVKEKVMTAESESPKAPKTPDQEEGVLYIGIDLGTSRTAIASSNGQRENVPSVLGYPKDLVSMKLLQKEVLYGDDAIRHRLSVDHRQYDIRGGKRG